MIALSSQEVRAVLAGLGYKQTAGPMADRRVAGIGAIVDALLRAEETVHAEIVDEAAEQLEQLRTAALEALQLSVATEHEDLIAELRRLAAERWRAS